MSASDHIQPYQMKLFMQAKELMEMPAGDFGGIPMAHHGGKNRKVREAKQGVEGYSRQPAKEGEQTLYDSIKEKGVQKPVTLYATNVRDNAGRKWIEELMDGHHRVATANDIDPESYVPVEYTGIPRLDMDDQRNNMIL
jgi:hypothetical protein